MTFNICLHVAPAGKPCRFFYAASLSAGQELIEMSCFLNAAEIDERRNELIDEASAIVEVARDEKRDLTDDETSRIDAIQGSDGKGGELGKLDADYNRVKAIEDRRAVKAAERAQPLVVDAGGIDNPLDAIRVPASCMINSNRKQFQGNDGAKAGYASGLWLASIAGNQWASDKLDSMGIRNAMSEGTNSAGGFTVPDPLSAEIIRLVEEYGVFRQFARVVPMTSDTLAVPRRTGGLTVYYPGEGAAITPSDLTFAQATLTAAKYTALTQMSTELNEDSVISMAALIADEIAYAFAVAEDTNGFKGDGTGTYASITGLSSALLAGATQDADSGETTVASLDLADYHAVVAKTPKYPGANNRWFVNSATWANSMQPLAYAAGGNTVDNIAGGMAMSFLGYPVTITQVLDDDGASNYVAYFGDLSLAATMGNRRDISIKTLNELYAASDQIGIVATGRSAITVHEVGTASVGGPINALKLAAS